MCLNTITSQSKDFNRSLAVITHSAGCVLSLVLVLVLALLAVTQAQTVSILGLVYAHPRLRTFLKLIQGPSKRVIEIAIYLFYHLQ